MKNFFKKALVILLALVLTIPTVNGVEAKADSKPTLSAKKITIGIGSYGARDIMGTYHVEKTRYALSVENSVKGAKYVFKSTDTNIVTVEKEGAVGYLTGVSAGTAKIKVKQKLDGKTTLVGKCKVTVKEATATASEYLFEDAGLRIGTMTTLIADITNFNPAAEYTYECNDSNFTMVDAREEEGDGWYTHYQTYVAKKAGTYTVTVKETYNNKTRNIGIFEVVVAEASVEPEVTFWIGCEEYLDWCIYNYCTDGYWYKLKEDGILEDLDGGCVKPAKEGTTTVDIWHYDAANDTKGEFIGTITVNVVAGEYDY